MNVFPLVIEKLLKDNVDDECFILSEYFKDILVLIAVLSSLVGTGLITTSKITCDGEGDLARAENFCIDDLFTVIGVDSLHPG
jgi:hypothetical protein